MTTKHNTRLYSDFDLDFKPHPLTGDLLMKFDAESIKRSMRHLIMLNAYEKPFRPEIAGAIRDMLFEPMGRNTAIGIEARIDYLIRQFEPRAELIAVNAEPDFPNNTYEVTIRFKVKNQLNPIETKIFLQRVR